MVILGVDPGTAITGYGILKKDGPKQEVIDYGVITTDSKYTDSHRLLVLGKYLDILINTYKPDVVAVEKLFFFRNTTTVITVAQARGLVLYTAEKYGKIIKEYTPLQIKQAVTGYGKADKKQMQTMITKLLGLEKIPKPDDAADGLAVAYTALSSLKYENLQ